MRTGLRPIRSERRPQKRTVVKVVRAKRDSCERIGVNLEDGKKVQECRRGLRGRRRVERSSRDVRLGQHSTQSSSGRRRHADPRRNERRRGK